MANNLLALGANVLCCGLLGQDKEGQFAIDQLKDRCGDTQGLIRTDDKYRTTVKQRLVGLAQGRIPQQLLRADYEAETPVDDQLAELLGSKATELAKGADIVAIEDYDKAVISRELIVRLTECSKRSGTEILVDPARLEDYSRYSGASWITPNRAEASLVSGVHIDSIQAADRAGRIIMDRWEFGAVLITLDRQGIYVLDSEGKSQHLATEPRDVYDVTGAGDMVLAALTMARASGADLSQAATLANVAGGLEVEIFGSKPIYPEQIAEHLWTRHREHVGKIRPLDELLRELQVQRKLGRKIVFTNGCFDLLHPGHVSYLESSALHGDILIVGMNSDQSVRKVKGQNRPITPQIDRARMLAALEVVDYVVIFDESSVQPLVEKVKPDVLVKGEDYGLEGVVGREFVESYGGKVALAKIEPEYSTTKMIQRIIERAGK